MNSPSTIRSSLTFRLVILACAFFAGNLRAVDLNQDYRPFSPSGATDRNPYDVVDLDNFDPGDFAHCRWGVFQDADTILPGEFNADLGYSSTTFSPPDKELFVSTSLTYLQEWNLLDFADPTWDLVNRRVSFPASSSGKTYNLLRKLHFQIRNALQNPVSHQILPQSTEKIIILIHGWNPDGNSDQYTGSAFTALSTRIGDEISTTDWHLMHYRWEQDADTGPKVDTGPILPQFFVNPSEAAEAGYSHGFHLGEILEESFPNLKRVHLVAHSAGTWVARSACRYLLDQTGVDVQVTFLDPYIPGTTGQNTQLTVSRIQALSDVANADRLFWLENIFAYDADSSEQWFLNSDTLYGATSQSFSWSFGYNQQVDWTPGETYPGDPFIQRAFYDYHDGPIDYYADTVLEVDPGSTAPAGLANPAFDLAKAGWRASMFMNEPRFTGALVSSQSQTLNPGDPLNLAVFAETRAGAFSGSATWQWYKDGVALAGQTASTLSIPSVSQADQGQYSVEVTYNGLASRSGSAVISIAGAGPYIITQPLSATVPQGGDAQFFVSAGGAPPLTYQWMQDGTDILGSNGASLVVGSVTTNDSGNQYSVRISNADGAVTSQVAVLTVSGSAAGDIYEPNDSSLTAAPMGTNDTRQAYIGSPSDADWFSVNVTEAGPLTINLTVPAGLDYDLELYGPDALFKAGSYGNAGANESITYNVTTLGTYTFRVYGWPVGAGSWSTTAPYTITTGFTQSDIVISTQPQDVTVPWGAAATFSVAASSSVEGPLFYQWRRNGVNISGATASSYTTIGTQLSDDGDDYDVVISNAFGFVTSAGANLDVTDPPDIVWTGAVSDEWNNTNNWNLGRTPQPGDVVRISSGAPVALSGFGGADHIILSGATLVWSGGELRGTLTVGSTSTLHAQSSSEKSLWGGRLVNYGHVTWDDGDISGQTYQANVNAIENMPGALFEINGGLVMQSYGRTTSTGPGQFSFSNSGTLRMSGTNTTEFQIGSYGGAFEFSNSGMIEATAGTLRFRIPMHNQGVVSGDSAAIQLRGGGTSSGSYISTNGATFELFGGTFEVPASFSGPGLVSIHGGINGVLDGSNFEVMGDLDGSFSVVGNLVWPKGDITGVLTIPAGSTLLITGIDEKDLWGGRLVNYGHVTWDDGDISGKTYQANVNAIENMPGALFEINGGLVMQSYGRTTSTGPGQFSFSNSGTLRMSGTNTTEIRVGSSGGAFDFHNSGTIEVNAGNLYFRIPLTQQSGEVILSAMLTSSQDIELTSGEIRGSGVLTGDVLNSGGVLKPGQSPGILTVHGNYIQETGGALELDIAGTIPGAEHDQLIVTGDVSLDGRVTIRLVEPYAPPTGQTFTAISAGGTLSGSFSEIAGAHVSRDVVFELEYTASAASLLTRSSRPYEQWAWDEFGGQVNDPAISTYFKDPERDGTINILEYAFALNPLLVDCGSLLSSDMVEDGAEDYLSITFTRPTGASDIMYIPEVSDDIVGGWDSGSEFTTIHDVIDHGDFQTVTIRDKTPVSSADRRFMRIRVELTE